VPLQLALQLAPTDPLHAFADLDLVLVGPFEALAALPSDLDALARPACALHCRWRFVHDPPEFLTALVCTNLSRSMPGHTSNPLGRSPRVPRVSQQRCLTESHAYEVSPQRPGSTCRSRVLVDATVVCLSVVVQMERIGAT
jgi:hypothetical protein